MFGALLGALGPVGWVAGGLITAATVAAASSSGGSTRHTNSNSVKREYKENKKEQLQEDIEEYIDKQIDFIKQKYNTDISVNNTVAELAHIPELGNFVNQLGDFKNLNIDEAPKIDIIQKDNSLRNQINILKTNASELEIVINLLRGVKSETLS